MDKDVDFRTLMSDAYRHQGPVGFDGARYSVTSRVYDGIPLHWEGGDLGAYAVCDSANRLLRRGATPRYFAATLIVDADTPVEMLHVLRESMRAALVNAEMECVSISTSVSAVGPRYGVSISTFAIGILPPDLDLGASCIEADDIILLSGSVGAHGVAVDIARGDAPDPIVSVSDSVASLGDMVHALLDEAPGLRAMMLPSGHEGLVGSLKRAAKRSFAAMNINRSLVPVDTAVAEYCNYRGLDPLELPSAGVMLVIVPRSQTRMALAAMHRSAYGSNAVAIGTVEQLPAGEIIIN